MARKSTSKPRSKAKTARKARAPRSNQAGFPKVSASNRPTVTPFLMFPSGCAEAVKLYTSAFKDGKILSLGDLGTAPDGTRMVNATFEVGGQRFLAMDGGPSFAFAQGLSLFVACKSQAEIDHFWNALSKGGEPGRCGWLTDRFGVSWQIIPDELGGFLGDSRNGDTGKAMQAILSMGKLDLAELRKAYARR